MKKKKEKDMKIEKVTDIMEKFVKKSKNREMKTEE